MQGINNSKKSGLDWFAAIAPFAIALVSLTTTVILAFLDKREKENNAKTAQLDAVSKVLVYLSDTSTRKNTMGLLALTNYGQDSLATKLMRSGIFSKQTLETAGIYIASNSDDTAIVNQVKGYFEPRQIALQNAINELNQHASSTTIGGNTGEFVRKYNSIAGLGEGEPWAATFVCWCYNKDIKYFESTGSINKLEEDFIKAGATFKLNAALPLPGDIYFYNWNNKRAIGIVEYFSNSDSLHGIEGNSNDDQNGPDYKVARVSFSKGELQRGNFDFADVK